jgi:hypothetical protein
VPEDSPTPPAVLCNNLYIADAREETFGKSTADVLLTKPPTPTSVTFLFAGFAGKKRADERT